MKIKPYGNYILIEPDRPKGGTFDAGETYINETGTVVDCGGMVSDSLKALKGKKVLFNAWACDEKKLGEVRYYFASEQSNAICGIFGK